MKRKMKQRNGKNEERYTDLEYKKMNKFKKGKYKINQLINSKEALKNSIYKIVQVIDKGDYNMYIAKNIRFNWILTLTDKDEYEVIGE